MHLAFSFTNFIGRRHYFVVFMRHTFIETSTDRQARGVKEVHLTFQIRRTKAIHRRSCKTAFILIHNIGKRPMG